MIQFLKDYYGIIITGPTACGKSSFSAKLANKINGVVINADSQQIYKEIPIISASPLIEPELLELAPHKLFGFRQGTDIMSASDYGTLAKQEFDTVIQNKQVPIFTGGTGFYLNALVNGLSPIPETDSESRERARKLTNSDLVSAYTELSNIDPISAKHIHFNDKNRISRALEVYYSTNKPLSYWQSLPLKPAINHKLLKILILPDKDILKERIKQRIQIMIQNGAFKEVQNIINKNYDINLPIMKADGIKELSGYILGKSSLENAISEMEFKSIHYMKRQITYFSHSFNYDILINHIPNESDIEKIIQ